MANLATRYAMGTDPVLRPRVAAAVVSLALDVIAAPVTPTEGGPPDAGQTRRRAFALDVTGDVQGQTVRAQWALACWSGSPLPDAYATGGADAITDDALRATLAAVWVATAGA